MATFPFVQASEIGRTPYRFAACGSAPAARSSSTIAGSSECAAQWSGVVPSGSAATTSAPRSMATRTPAASATRIASIRLASAASPGAVAPPAGAKATNRNAINGRIGRCIWTLPSGRTRIAGSGGGAIVNARTRSGRTGCGTRGYGP